MSEMKSIEKEEMEILSDPELMKTIQGSRKDIEAGRVKEISCVQEYAR